MRQLRNNFPIMQRLFDGPSANESCPRRHVSTVPLQPLYLLNNPFILRQAELFAARVLAKAGQDPFQQIESAFALALGRLPEKVDIEAVRAFLDSQEYAATRESQQTLAGNPGQPPLKLVHFCHALLNLNEFVYLE